MSSKESTVCELFERNSYFCASGECPDEQDIPDACTGRCLVEGRNHGDKGSPSLILQPELCDLREICPCAHPANAARLAAFKAWESKKKVRDALAKVEKKSHHYILLGEKS